MRRIIIYYISVVGFILSFLSNVHCQNNDEARIVKLEAGTIKISLVIKWERKGQEKLSKGALFMRKNPDEVLAFDIYPITTVSLFSSNDKSYQSEYLNGVKKLLEGPGVLFEENTSFFNVPMLIVNSETKDGAKEIRDMHFLKNSKYYIITFVCEKKYFNEEWASIEPRIRNIEFTD